MASQKINSKNTDDKNVEADLGDELNNYQLMNVTKLLPMSTKYTTISARFAVLAFSVCSLLSSCNRAPLVEHEAIVTEGAVGFSTEFGMHGMKRKIWHGSVQFDGGKTALIEHYDSLPKGSRVVVKHREGSSSAEFVKVISTGRP